MLGKQFVPLGSGCWRDQGRLEVQSHVLLVSHADQRSGHSGGRAGKLDGVFRVALETQDAADYLGQAVRQLPLLEGCASHDGNN